jgi:hypothetical protein
MKSYNIKSNLCNIYILTTKNMVPTNTSCNQLGFPGEEIATPKFTDSKMRYDRMGLRLLREVVYWEAGDERSQRDSKKNRGSRRT